MVHRNPPRFAPLVVAEGHNVTADVHEEARVARKMGGGPTDSEGFTDPG